MISIADLIEFVKVSLGLPNNDIAKIFRISRQTLYAYKNSASDQHTVDASNKERALILSGIINEIRPKFPYSPGAMAKNYMMDGKSLVDLLSADELNIPSIVRIADSLASKISSHLLDATFVNEISLYQLTPVA